MVHYIVMSAPTSPESFSMPNEEIEDDNLVDGQSNIDCYWRRDE